MSHLGRPKISFTLPTASWSPVFYTERKVSELSHTLCAQLTFMRSSLILIHGKSSSDASLMTIFRALLFATPPLDTERKSFVRNVPIPNDAGFELGRVNLRVPVPSPIPKETYE